MQPNNVVNRPCPNTSGSTARDTTSECFDDSSTKLSSLLTNIEQSGTYFCSNKGLISKAYSNLVC